MSNGFNNKTIVITGGSKGIGAATVRKFLEEGANTVVLDIAPPEIGWAAANFLYLDCDVSDDERVKYCMDEAKARFGAIHLLVNNAGIQEYGTVTNTSIEVWDRVMNINLKSYFICSRHAIPYMLESGGGTIINVSSVQAFHTQQQVAAYTTAKTAILGLTRSIAVDYAPQVRCVAVCPGTIDTPMLQSAAAQSPDPQSVIRECEDMHLARRIGSPDEVAALILFLCSPQAAFITGEAIRIDGGLGIMIQGSKK